MNLHIITPVTRPENLPRILRSIEDSSIPQFDIDWYVVFDCASSHMIISNENIGTIYEEFKSKENQICGYVQRNHALDQIADGWVYFLDDDTIMHKDMLTHFFSEYDEFHTCYLFTSKSKDMNFYCELEDDFTNVAPNRIDIGQFIIKRETIGNTRFREDIYNADGYFINQIFQENQDKFKNINGFVWYNKLR
jgi:hypothetical protein